MFAPKPSVVQDIKPEGKNLFRPIEERINLKFRPRLTIPWHGIIRGGVTLAAIAFLTFGSVAAPTTTYTLAQTTVSKQEERAALEAQLKDIEAQIDQYEAQIQSYQKQGKSLKGEIGRLNDQVAKLNLNLRWVNIQLRQLGQRMEETQGHIADTEASLTTNRTALAGLLRNVYQNDQTNILEIFLKNPQISDFFNDVSQTDVLQKDVRVTITRVNDLNTQLKDQQDQLAAAKSDAEDVQAYQEAKKQEASSLRKQKDELLRLTKGQESKYQDIVKQRKQEAAKIRTRIFELLGGGQLTFEQAYNFAKVAANATGVREALILAVLDRESALGRNVGRCAYQKAMSPDNRPVFEDIVGRLKDAGKFVGEVGTTMVSCANSDGAYGGAMGPAQFLPKTWVTFEDRIAQITGNRPPSPWASADAFAATALYMQDAGAAGGSVSQERMAAAKYYAGNSWRRFLWTYGEAVVSRANKFQADIDAIEDKT